MSGVFSIPKLSRRAESHDLEVPTITLSDFTQEDELGSGSYGTVYAGKYQNRNDVIVKVLKSERRENKRLFLKEARLLHEIKGHENIATFIAFCTTPTYTMITHVLLVTLVCNE